jgi:hypothetical protein
MDAIETGLGGVAHDEHPKTWLPTRKWWAALFSGAFTIGAHAVGSHGWDGPEWAEFLTLLAALASAYGAANHDTPGGLPPRASADSHAGTKAASAVASAPPEYSPPRAG